MGENVKVYPGRPAKLDPAVAETPAKLDPAIAGASGRSGQVQTVELTALDIEELESVEPADLAEGWDVEEARSTLLHAATQAEGAPKRVKDSVFPPKESPTLRMPAAVEVGPPGHVPLSATAGIPARSSAATRA